MSERKPSVALADHFSELNDPRRREGTFPLHRSGNSSSPANCPVTLSACSGSRRRTVGGPRTTGADATERFPASSYVYVVVPVPSTDVSS